MRKKIKFENLKPGRKFRYERKLFIVDHLCYAVQLSNGQIHKEFCGNDLVTPVKVQIRVK